MLGSLGAVLQRLEERSDSVWLGNNASTRVGEVV